MGFILIKPLKITQEAAALTPPSTRAGIQDEPEDDMNSPAKSLTVIAPREFRDDLGNAPRSGRQGNVMLCRKTC